MKESRTTLLSQIAHNIENSNPVKKVETVTRLGKHENKKAKSVMITGKKFHNKHIPTNGKNNEM